MLGTPVLSVFRAHGARSTSTAMPMPPETQSVAMPRRCPRAAMPCEQGDDDAGAGGADRVAEGDGAAVRVDPRGIERQLGETGEHLAAKASLSSTASMSAKSSPLPREQGARRRHRADPHDPRVDADDLPVEQVARRRRGRGARPPPRVRHQQRGGAVGDARGVARRDRAALAEDRRQLGERLRA